MTPPDNTGVPVAQEDRVTATAADHEAALTAFNALCDFLGGDDLADPLVQAFARARLASRAAVIEECAKVADNLNAGVVAWHIRNLKDKSND